MKESIEERPKADLSKLEVKLRKKIKILSGTSTKKLETQTRQMEYLKRSMIEADKIYKWKHYDEAEEKALQPPA